MKSNATHGSGVGAHPIDRLEQEHEVILRVLTAADTERILMERGAPLRERFWRTYLDFLANYADSCHHEKEENCLFAALESRGMPGVAGPTECMRHEHIELRTIRARLAEAITSDDVETICHLVRKDVDELRLHIQKENEVLFPLAREVLDEAATAALASAFESLEKAMGDARARYEAVAEALCNDSPFALPS